MFLTAWLLEQHSVQIHRGWSGIRSPVTSCGIWAGRKPLSWLWASFSLQNHSVCPWERQAGFGISCSLIRVDIEGNSKCCVISHTKCPQALSQKCSLTRHTAWPDQHPGPHQLHCFCKDCFVSYLSYPSLLCPFLCVCKWNTNVSDSHLCKEANRSLMRGLLNPAEFTHGFVHWTSLEIQPVLIVWEGRKF